MTHIVFDSGALLALEKRSGRMMALLEEVLAHQVNIHIPAGVLAQSWRANPTPALLARLLKDRQVGVDSLDTSQAKAVGVMCGLTSTSDVVDASVALVAQRLNAPVVTSDPDDIRRLNPTLHVVSI